jgi:hypothetical protein
MQTLCDKINAFEKHVLDRQLRIAQILGKHFEDNSPGDPLSESAFAILSLCLQYFEMYEQFSSGKDSSIGQSKDFFECGFKKVFPDYGLAARSIASIYKKVRCGMYHTAMPKDRCGLSRDLLVPISDDNGVILINPSRFVGAIIDHFNQYCMELRVGADNQLQANFETMWDLVAQQCKSSVAARMTATPTTPEPTFYRP